ncbi:hypothetical protein TrVFT333_010762 [Trichoderma virens FT-333]|nr:hypothetical protein TrVFT333_010762 [Trichoderma virens FT-333]
MAAVANPALGSNEIPTYHQIPETTYDLEWADLVTLDLSQFEQPGGKERLAKQLHEAIQKIGFFYITNFGLSQEAVDRQFAIGKEVFKLPMEEKLRFRAELETGGYNGYKPLGLREIAPGIFDNTEIYNIGKFIPAYERPQPEIINQNRGEIEQFARHIHDHIVGKLLVLCAILLELPEDYFLNCHRYDEKSDCHLRYMKYYRRTEAENRALDNVWVKGHTDFGSLTLLFRQPVSALQVRTPEGNWRWVRPYPESITVNLADSLDFLTNGYLKVPFTGLSAHPRSARASTVLERLGYDKVADSSAVGITAGEWVKARVAKGVAKDNKPRSEVGEQAIVGGLTAKYYD